MNSSIQNDVCDIVTYFTREPRIIQCVVCERFLAIPYNYIGAIYHLQGWKTSDGKLHYGFHCGQCFDKMHNIEAYKLKRPTILNRRNHETF